MKQGNDQGSDTSGESEDSDEQMDDEVESNQETKVLKAQIGEMQRRLDHEYDQMSKDFSEFESESAIFQELFSKIK